MSSRASGSPMGHIMLLLAIPLLAYLTFAVGSKALELYRLQERSREVRQEIDQLKDQNLALREQAEYLRSDSFIEDAARRQLGLIKPGDGSVILVAPSQAPEMSSKTSTSPVSTGVRANWQEWWDFFFR